MEWAFERGGLSAEEEYPYQGINNYCREDAPSVIKFKEPKQVTCCLLPQCPACQPQGTTDP